MHLYLCTNFVNLLWFPFQLENKHFAMNNMLLKSLNINLRNYFRDLLIISLFVFSSYNAYCIKGGVVDNYGKIVPFATIRFVDQSDSTKVFMGFTDALGNYNVDVPLINYSDGNKNFMFFDIYPNPATNGVVIPLNLMNAGYLLVYVYNTYGERVNTIYDGNYSSGLYQFIWDGRTNAHQRVAPGIYFVQVIFNGRTATRKVVLMENDGNAVSPVPMNNFLNKFEPFKIKYTVTITRDSVIDPFYLTNYEVLKPDSNNFMVNRHVPIPYRVEGNFLSVYNINDSTYKKIFIKGINLGVGIPGTYPGDLAADSLTYVRWFKMMDSAGFNAIRVYTLHYPRFYNAIAKHNEDNPDHPLYLLHGIWLDEDTIYKLNNNFYKYAEGYDIDIKEIVDCLHGRKIIGPRPGRAYGTFNTDVSRWVIGYIEGREISPYEVLGTDTVNTSHTSYNGYSNAIILPSGGTPMECWMAAHLDYLVKYERTTYFHERPVSFTSWPTLDPIKHPTEHPNYGSSEDIVQVNLNKLVLKNAPAGFFLSYHVYPYFPDFITQGPYHLYSDSIGPCPYFEYVKTLKGQYNYPLLVAEFGVPTSWGNAHFEFNGMTQGDEDEVQQGDFNVRMYKDIYQAGCAGGCMFAWINENFKQSWIIDPTSCGVDRRILWHNLASPEENFGLLKFVEDPPSYNRWPATYPSYDSSRIKKIQADYDNEYFYVNVAYNSLLATDSLYIGFDTYGDAVGENFFPNHVGTVYNFCEFMLVITSDSANLYVEQTYDTYCSSPKFPLADSAVQKFHSEATGDVPWNILRWRNNFPDSCNFYAGRLRNCNFTDTPSSNTAVVRYPDHVEVRIPWHFLNFTDPSDLEALDCETCTGNGIRPHEPPISMFDASSLPRETTYTTGIALSVLMGNDQNNLVETSRFLWNTWGIDMGTGLYTPPSPVKEVKKQSYNIIKNCLLNTPFTPY